MRRPARIIAGNGYQTPPAGIRVRVRDVIAATIKVTGVSAEDLLGERRLAGIVRARHLAMAVAYEVTGRSGPFIADQFQRCEHTAIVHAVQMTQKRLQNDPALAAAKARVIDESIRLAEEWHRRCCLNATRYLELQHAAA